jgi:hypothetical protein
MSVLLRVFANNATGGAVCGTSLYSATRTRNLVYCPPTLGINIIRMQRDTGTSSQYIYVTEIEVFRGGVSDHICMLHSFLEHCLEDVLMRVWGGGEGGMHSDVHVRGKRHLFC